MRIVLKVLLYAAALWLAVALIDGLDFTGDWIALLGVAVVLGLVNAVAKPIVKLLSLPFILATLGLFLLLVNTLMLWITIRISDQLQLGISSEGFGATFLGAFVVSVVMWIGGRVVEDD